MSRDKQIAEMAKVMVDENNKEVVNALSMVFASSAEVLYNAGYRKSEDVAREIFEDIEASAKVKYWRGGGLVVFEVNGEDFAELKKKYTESENDNE